jgi:hypothetical protein
MPIFQKTGFSMSDDSAYRLAKMLFGLDCGELDVALDNLNERYFQPIAQVAKILAQKIAPAPEIPSYDKLLGREDSNLRFMRSGNRDLR